MMKQHSKLQRHTISDIRSHLQVIVICSVFKGSSLLPFLYGHTKDIVVQSFYKIRQFITIEHIQSNCCRNVSVNELLAIREDLVRGVYNIVMLFESILQDSKIPVFVDHVPSFRSL